VAVPKASSLIAAAAVMAAMLSVDLVRGEDQRLARLTSEHRTWLEEEAVYLITDRERDVFLSIDSLEERNRFIEAFWKRRDKIPETPVNEFKEEHYRRIEHANERFARQTSRPGWKTDQGRIYITLGEPRQIERFEAHQNIAYCELWTYQSSPDMGLPPFFHLLFWKRHDVGEYEIYSPLADGPLKLVRGIDRYTNDPTVAIQELLDISPNLAHASLTFDLSEGADFETGQASLGSELIVGRIADVPRRVVRTDYADAWLRYRDKVSAEYSFNFVPSRTVVAVLGGPWASSFVHYRVELDPGDFSLVQGDGAARYFTTLDVSIEVTEEDGRRVFARDKEVYVELSSAEIRDLDVAPFAYEDDFPLIPGDYRLVVILRNRAVAEYTVLERELVIPDVSAVVPGLSSLVVAYDVQQVEDAREGEVLTFQIGPRRFYPAADGAFFAGETATALLQIFGGGTGYRLEWELSSEVGVIERRTRDVERAPPVLMEESFALTGMVGGRYTLAARLVDGGGLVVAERSQAMSISPRGTFPRAWVHRRSFDARQPGALDLVLGEQLQVKGRYEEAARNLGAAVLANPELHEARWRLAGIQLGWRRPDEALALLLPIEEAAGDRYEVVAGLGFAFYMKNEPSSAAPYLERAASIREPGTSLLNALGDCYAKLGDRARAREVFERSLALDSDQPVIRERLASL
jgi:GWxTD domain-containing protein